MIRHPLPTLLPLAVLASGFGVEASSARAPEQTPAAPTLRAEKHVLPNGLELVLHVDRRLPLVAFNEYYLVGSRDDPPGRRGMAHLVEHLMFDGSKNAGPFFKEFSKTGGTTTSVNATTSEDHTTFFATVPSDGLEHLVWVASDRLATLTETVTEEKLQRSREILQNERLERVEDTPEGIVAEILPAYLFSFGHPYATEPYGPEADLHRITVQDVREFLRTYYVPNRLSLVLAGDLSPSQSRRLVEKYYGPIPAGRPFARVKNWTPRIDSRRVIEARANVPTERLIMAWVAPSYYEPQQAEIEIACSILAEGLSSRLHSALIDNRSLATEVRAIIDNGQELSGHVLVYASAKPGKSLVQIEQVITTEVDQLAELGPTTEELRAAKARIELSFWRNLEELGGYYGKANLLNYYNTLLNTPNRLQEDLARYRGVSAESLRLAVKRWIQSRDPLVVRVRPARTQPTAANSLDRSQPPPKNVLKTPRLPEIRRSVLPNGLEVYLLERRDVPIVSVRLAVRAGSSIEPPDKPGLAGLTSYVLQWETKNRDLERITAELNLIGGEIDRDVRPAFASYGVRVQRKDLNTVLDLISDMVLNPSFEVSYVRYGQEQNDESIQELDTYAPSVATRLALVLGFGPDHPFARMPAQSTAAKSKKKITISDVREFHRKYWRPRGSAVVFVGPLTMDAAVRLARRYFGEWSGAGSAPPPVPVPRPAAGGRIYAYDRPGLSQGHMVLLLPLPARSEGLELALAVAESAWGGGPESRINQLLREQRGVTYAAMSTSFQLEGGGIWWSQTSVQSDKLKQAIEDLRGELAAMNDARKISPEELERVKASLARRYADQFETHSDSVEAIVDLWADRRPPSYIRSRAKEVTSITLESIRTAVSRYARPDRAIILVVGDLRTIEPSLKSIQGLDLVILDSTGRPAGTASSSERQ